MGLFFNRKIGPELEREELAERLGLCTDMRAFYLEAIRALLVFLKDFSLDQKEIDPEEFKKGLDLLEERFVREEKIRSIRSCFEGEKKPILSFIRRQKDYLKEREEEFKGIIDLLTRGVAALNAENQEFNGRIYEKSEKIEKISLLDDIKKIKQDLKVELDQMRETVRDKQNRDAKRVERLSQQVGALRQELEKVKTESSKDGLTGVFNRSAFDARMRILVDRNSIRGFSFSLLMMDIDNFKKINDSFGHPVGDRVLLALVQKCREFVRKDDFFARYGGEEFTLILPGASLRNALKMARRICRGVASTRYAVSDIMGGDPISFTVSIGASTFRKGDTVASLIDRADKALYTAKRSGKNCTCSENDIPSS